MIYTFIVALCSITLIFSLYDGNYADAYIEGITLLVLLSMGFVIKKLGDMYRANYPEESEKDKKQNK